MMCKFVEKHLSHDSFSDGVKLAANYLTAARMCCLFFLVLSIRMRLFISLRGLFLINCGGY